MPDSVAHTANDDSLLLGGQTMSSDFPVTEGAIQPPYGGEPTGTGHAGVQGGDCFLARFSANSRTIRAATFFGGSKQERDVCGSQPTVGVLDAWPRSSAY